MERPEPRLTPQPSQPPQPSQRPNIAASLVQSARLFAARKASVLALGVAVVVALCATCCGLGLFATPWFLCELLALQLGTARGTLVARSRGFWIAGGVLLGAVLLTASVAWLTWLGVGLDPRGAGGAPGLPSSAWLLIPASAVAVLVFVLPFLYAPLILIEGEPRLLGAVERSAQLVWHGGAGAHLWLSMCANAVQVAPLVLGSLTANAIVGPELGALWTLASLPFLSLTVPLGQGMIVSSYAVQPVTTAAEAPRAASSPRALQLTVAVFLLLWLSPLASFGLLGASLARPARLSLVASEPEAFARALQDRSGASYARREPSYAGEPVLELEVAADRASGLVQGTTLTVHASARAVRVEAGDGGGAGKLQLPSSAPIERVRVVRRGELYALLVTQGDQQAATVIDRAGVRLDDDLRARLFDHIDRTRLLWMVASLLLTAIVQLPLLANLGRTREPGRGVRRALSWCLALLPGSLLSVFYGLEAALG